MCAPGTDPPYSYLLTIPVRRVVTGHNQDGLATFISDAPVPTQVQTKHRGVFVHVCGTVSPHRQPSPERLDDGGGAGAQRGWGPGFVRRPGCFVSLCRHSARRGVAYVPIWIYLWRRQILSIHFFTNTGIQRRTLTFDFVIVISGAVQLTLDSGEQRVMKQGDVIQIRRTNHSGKNPHLTEWTRMYAVVTNSLPVRISGVGGAADKVLTMTRVGL
ncbi:hypothetical protein C8J57DRAFT_186172 [Mycena rebaudengoi]|nr:hypothetical protein C8J57DRAFT_186172 [Mycena rebaudengoi]